MVIDTDVLIWYMKGNPKAYYHKIRLDYGQPTPVFDYEYAENALFLNN